MQQLVDQVKYLVAWETAGRPTDWAEYPFEVQSLYVYWRDAEEDVRKLRDFRQATYIKRQLAAPPIQFNG